VAALEQQRAAEFATIDAGFRAHRTLRMRIGSAARAVNETLRVELRRIEHPGLFRAPTLAD
jgi:hypothetical protein